MDNNCDGVADGPDASDATTWHVDGDGDGYGDAAVGTLACAAPDGMLADGDDCDDTNAAVSPGGTERCNATDDNCDGLVDEDTAVDATTWLLDADADGYGDDAVSVTTCASPSGYLTGGGDCNDGDPAYNPAAAESCTDPNDYNCDGSVSYADVDGDDFPACVDCDDSSAAIAPSAPERCDGVDNNCDGLVDASTVGDEVSPAVDATEWYPDADDDDYGDGSLGVVDCAAPAGFVADGTDCDDQDGAYHPGAEEGDCSDPNDYNCDGTVAWADADADNFAACEECDDGSASVNPAATEVCNERDDDCDGDTDGGAADAVAWYADSDGDGFVDAGQSLVACSQPDGYSTETAADCDDADPLVFPGAVDIAGDGVDQDCEGGDAFVEGEGDTGGGDKEAGGCGCGAGGGTAGIAMVAVAAVVGRRRRRPAPSRAARPGPLLA